MSISNSIRKILIFVNILTIGLFFEVFSQTLQIDSLHHALEKTTQDTARLSILTQLSKAYWYVKPAKSVAIGQQAYQLATALKDERRLSVASFNLGIGYWVQDKYDSALEKVTYALDISQKVDDLHGIARAYGGLGVIHRSQGYYAKALEYQHKALEINEKLGYKRGIAIAYTNMGVIYYSQGDLVKALEYNLKALKSYESMGSKLELAGAYNNLGVIYNDQEKHEEALIYYRKAQDIQQEINDRKGVAHAYVNMGNVFAAQDKDSLALANFHKAKEIYNDLNDRQGIAAALTSIGDIYALREKYALAQQHYQEALTLLRAIGYQQGKVLTLNGMANAFLKSGQYPLSIKYAQESLQLAATMQAKGYAKNASETLYQSFQALGDFENAFQYHKLFTQYKDSLLNEENIKKLEEIKFNYEIEKMEAENAVLRRQNEWQAQQVSLQKALRNVFIIGSALLLGLAFTFLMGKQKEQKANALLSQKNKEISAIAEDLSTANAEIEAQKQNLERLNQAKDRLFSVISHDLRSPLNSLHGLLILLQEGHLSQQEIQQVIPELTQRLHQSHNLLDNLLVWAKSQMQGMGPHPREINLQWIAEETIELLQAPASQKNISLTHHIHSTAKAYADQDMIKLVLRNLVANAIKFTPDGGKVNLYAEKVGGGFMQMSVKDTGVGMEVQDQKKLFTGQGYSTKGTSGEKGTGLGLLLSKDFVESNGGTIWVESQKNKGSSFYFTLPASKTHDL